MRLSTVSFMFFVLSTGTLTAFYDNRKNVYPSNFPNTNPQIRGFKEPYIPGSITQKCFEMQSKRLIDVGSELYEVVLSLNDSESEVDRSVNNLRQLEEHLKTGNIFRLHNHLQWKLSELEETFKIATEILDPLATLSAMVQITVELISILLYLYGKALGDLMGNTSAEKERAFLLFLQYGSPTSFNKLNGMFGKKNPLVYDLTDNNFASMAEIIYESVWKK